MLSSYLDKVGYDANITRLYDDMLDRFAGKFDLRIEQSNDNIDDIIRTRSTLVCWFWSGTDRLSSLPIPVGSKYGPTVTRQVIGYFIVRGIKLVVTSIDQTLPSYPLVVVKDDSITARYVITEHYSNKYITLEFEKGKDFVVHVCKKRLSVPEYFALVQKTFKVDILILNIRCKIVCSTLSNNDSVITYICDSLISTPVSCVEDSDILKYLSSSEHAIDIMCIMLVRVIKASIDGSKDDIDDEAFKRVESAALLFEPILFRVTDQKKKVLRDRLTYVETIIINKFISGDVNTRSDTNKTGVIQELEQITIVDSLSHIRRVKTYMIEDQAPMRVREYNASHRGYFCMYETSDSKSAGLNKSLASTVVLSLRYDYKPNYLSTDVSGIPVFHNCAIVGFTEHYDKIISDIHSIKCKDLGCHVSAYVKNNILCICSDEGRLMRPLRYKDKVMMMDIGEYQYFDTQEVTELAPMGLSAALISFSNMSPGPRNTYQASMNKQAISYAPYKASSTSHEEKILLNKQYPLMSTDYMIKYLDTFLDFRHTNVVVAIMSDLNNNEDAIILNKASVQRGMFSNIKLTNERIFKHDMQSGSSSNITEIKPSGGFVKVFSRINFDHAAPHTVYDAVNNKYIQSSSAPIPKYTDKGTIGINNVVEPGDILQTIQDRSKLNTVQNVRYVSLHNGLVTNNICCDKSYDSTHHYVEVQLERIRIADIGDKLATDISQKGVIAELRDDWDMPYMADGTIPDLIFNPHGFPSRMTVGTLLSAAIGRYLCETSSIDNVIKPYLHKNGSFNSTPYKDMEPVIEFLRHNYNEKVPLHGCKSNITVGVLPYLALKQQVDEKSAARLTGPNIATTGQPVSGRKRKGGSAMGEMEVNALIAYGASNILHERLGLQTDLVQVLACTSCGLTNTVGDTCPRCGHKTTYISTRRPFISFINIMDTLGISVTDIHK